MNAPDCLPRYFKHDAQYTIFRTKNTGVPVLSFSLPRHHLTPMRRICRILYNLGVDRPTKRLLFRGTSRVDLGSFSESARSEAGYQLYLVQRGTDPEDWKPMNTVGPGVREIRIHDNSGAFRVIYVATFAEAVYVLHCFRKKTQKTRKQDIELAQHRYRELVKELTQ